MMVCTAVDSDTTPTLLLFMCCVSYTASASHGTYGSHDTLSLNDSILKHVSYTFHDCIDNVDFHFV